MSTGSLLSEFLAAAAAALLAVGAAFTGAPGQVHETPTAVPGTVLTDDVATASATSTLTEAQLAEAIAAALEEAPGTAHVSVRDAATGQELYAQQADDAVAPASSLKVLTAATALRALGPDTTLRTRTVLVDPGTPDPAVSPATSDPAVSPATPTSSATPTSPASPTAPTPSPSPTPTTPTEVVLVGGGDVLLGTGDSDPNAVSGRAGLRTLAAETAQAMADAKITGEVVVSVDLRLFEDDGRNPAWAADLYEAGYISPVQPLATFGGRAEYGTGQERVEDPAAQTALAFQSELADAVESQGGDLTVTVADTVPATTQSREAVLEAEPLGVVESASIEEQVGFMLAHSDNQLAEALARVAAHALGRAATDQGAASLMADMAVDLGAAQPAPQIADASGLALGNRISVSQLTSVLTGAARSPQLSGVLDGLAAPGTDSTLRERLTGTAAESRVTAKTGTLLSAVSLTGRVTTEAGQELLFSIVLDQIDMDVSGARDAVDRVAVALAEL
ncbi:MAG: D-alanyl-D-alanine carboxypeptidase [Micrococcus sp.]|nr:D-alanyl-D-alanine carboxypeptidase [Micrococcus sp.]